MKWNRLLLTLPVLGLLLLSACATPLQGEKLVAATAVAPQHTTGKRIQVGPVTVSHVPKPSWTEPQWQHLDQAVLTEAIVTTLTRSGLFSQVSTTGPADYRLSADVVGQQLVGTMSNISMLLVRYQLVDTVSGKTLWSENLFSFHHLSASDVFMGTDRVAQVVETAVRNNLKQLVGKISEALVP